MYTFSKLNKTSLSKYLSSDCIKFLSKHPYKVFYNDIPRKQISCNLSIILDKNKDDILVFNFYDVDVSYFISFKFKPEITPNELWLLLANFECFTQNSLDYLSSYLTDYLKMYINFIIKK